MAKKPAGFPAFVDSEMPAKAAPKGKKPAMPAMKPKMPAKGFPKKGK